MKIFCQKPFKPEKNQNLRKAYCQKTLFARHMKQYEATKLKPNKPKKKKTKKGGKNLKKSMSPSQPQHTDTHTETFFSRRKTQFEGNRPKHIKPKKNKKQKVEKKPDT